MALAQLDHRDRRPGEAMEAYHFTDAERFLAHVADDGFLEWVEFLDYYQGTRCRTRRRVTTSVRDRCARRRADPTSLPDALLIFVDARLTRPRKPAFVGVGSEEKVQARLAKAAERKPKRSNST